MCVKMNTIVHDNDIYCYFIHKILLFIKILFKKLKIISRKILQTDRYSLFNYNNKIFSYAEIEYYKKNIDKDLCQTYRI